MLKPAIGRAPGSAFNSALARDILSRTPFTAAPLANLGTVIRRRGTACRRKRERTCCPSFSKTITANRLGPANPRGRGRVPVRFTTGCTHRSRSIAPARLRDHRLETAPRAAAGPDASASTTGSAPGDLGKVSDRRWDRRGFERCPPKAKVTCSNHVGRAN
jgi:hypothetical protein